MTGDQGWLEQRAAAELTDFAAERPGEPACLLRRVCQACGAVADTDPPTVCPECGSEMPGS
jgi:hypothetical protein